MSSTRQLMLCLFALTACLLTACQGGKDMKYYNFPDAVTSINQVDPAYRKYFADQQGRNYSADDQRKALAAAIRTSRTPVPAYVPRSAMASSKTNARSRGKASSRRTAVARGKKTTSRRAVARNTSKATSSKRAVTKKATTKKKTVARSRSTARRRRG
ncbi:MAG: hypothetical protein IKW19_03815 [Akkermansia sp.]|nr:hypothetical protein [Akkermansia sp.]